MQIHSAGKEARLIDDGLIQGQWCTLRLVVEGRVNSVRTRTFVNGEKRLEVRDGEVRNHEWFHIRSDGDQDAWEIDYVRWKNTALDVGVPLERPATLEERMAELLRIGK